MQRIIGAFLLFIFAFQSQASIKKYLAVIPFDFVGSYIVVKTKINGSSDLELILDSGVRYTIVTELSSSDSVSIKYANETELLGLGVGNPLGAWVSQLNEINVNDFYLQDKTVYVLKQDIFNLTRHAGRKINGLLGYDFFKDNIVTIDYNRKKIYIHNPDAWVAPKSGHTAPLIVENEKMYMETNINKGLNSEQQVRLLLDTGAELPAWFRAFGNNSVPVPDKRIYGLIGQGLNGEILGNISRINNISIGNYIIKDPIVSFPDSISIAPLFVNENRDGTLGSQILRRFNITFDNPGRKVHFRKNSLFYDRFNYNAAGIEVVQPQLSIPMVEVVSVWPGSPAEKAGVKVGDKIIGFNFKMLGSFTLQDLKDTFCEQKKTSVKLNILRGENTINISLKYKPEI